MSAQPRPPLPTRDELVALRAQRLTAKAIGRMYRVRGDAIAALLDTYGLPRVLPTQTLQDRVSRDELARLHQAHTLDEIAARLGCSRSRVRDLVALYRLPPKPRHRPSTNPGATVLAGYVAAGLSSVEMAERCAVDPATINRWLRECGLRRPAPPRKPRPAAPRKVKPPRRHLTREQRAAVARLRDGLRTCRERREAALARLRARHKSIRFRVLPWPTFTVTPVTYPALCVELDAIAEQIRTEEEAGERARPTVTEAQRLTWALPREY